MKLLGAGPGYFVALRPAKMMACVAFVAAVLVLKRIAPQALRLPETAAHNASG